MVEAHDKSIVEDRAVRVVAPSFVKQFRSQLGTIDDQDWG